MPRIAVFRVQEALFCIFQLFLVKDHSSDLEFLSTSYSQFTSPLVLSQAFQSSLVIHSFYYELHHIHVMKC